MTAVDGVMYANDVKRALSVVIDIDDVGEDGLRRRKIEETLRYLKEQGSCAFGFVCRFSVEERGWSIPFALNVEAGECVLRLADRYDYSDDGHGRWERMDKRRQVESKRVQNLSVQLCSVDKLTVDELLAAVASFLVADVMDG